MFGRLIDGVFVQAPGMLAIGDRVYYQPGADLYLSQGYKPLVETPYPEIEVDGDETELENVPYYAMTYEEQADRIVQTWVEAEWPSEPENEYPTRTDYEAALAEFGVV